MLACPCCGEGSPSIALLIVLEHLRMHFNAPVKINSGARCAKHNLAVTKNPNSRSEHLITDAQPLFDAADIVVEGISATKVVVYLKSLPYANLLGIGKYSGRTHVDVRGFAARW